MRGSVRNSVRGAVRGPVWGGFCAAVAMAAAGSSAAVSPLVLDYPWAAGQCWRYLAAGLVLLATVRGTPGPALRAGQWGRIGLLAATGLAGFNFCLLHAVRQGDPAVVGAVVGVSPVLLALLGPLLTRRRPSGRIVGSAVLVSLGLVLLHSAATGSVAGLPWAVGALACECCFSLLAVDLLALLGPARLSALACLAAALISGVLALLTEGRAALRLPTGAEAAVLGYLALVVTALAFYLWYSAVRTLGVARAGLFVGVLPLGTVLAGPLLGTARITPTGALGALLVGGAVLWGVSTPGSEAVTGVAGPRRALSRRVPRASG